MATSTHANAAANISEFERLLKAVRDSPPLSEQNNAVVVDGKTWRRIADALRVPQQRKKSMATEIDNVLKHAQLAHFDNEVSSMIVLMIVKGEPEVHMAIDSKDLMAINANVDMLKTEIIILMKQATQDKEDRK